MKLLLVTNMDPYVRSVATVCNYIAAGRSLGHEVALFGEPNPQFETLPFTLDASKFDYAVFVLQIPTDLPDMPHLARLLDTIPRERRVILDLWGRYNDTIRVDHDFNHLEKVDGHQGWEWVDALHSVSGTILQPTVTRPLRSDVRPFLFHAFDAAAVSPKDAVAEKRYGVLYIGNNWQRWEQIRKFLEQIQPVRDRLGPVGLVGWDWEKRPEWAIQVGIQGIDVDQAFLKEKRVESRNPIRFEEVKQQLGQAMFSPVFHRPLFRQLGFVTNRTFETFAANTMPLLMLPEEQVEAIYGPAALQLLAAEDPAAKIDDMMCRPERYWEVIVKTRAHLALKHSFQERFRTLETLLNA